MLMTAAAPLEVPGNLQGLQEVYRLRDHYADFDEAAKHLQIAAHQAAWSTDRSVCEDERVRGLLKINPQFSSFWEISWHWYQELISQLITMFPEVEEEFIKRLAENRRNLALLEVRW